MEKLSKYCKTNQFKQLINTITRPDSNTCIDLILTNSEIVKESGTLDINISDDLPIFLLQIVFVPLRILNFQMKGLYGCQTI